MWIALRSSTNHTNVITWSIETTNYMYDTTMWIRNSFPTMLDVLLGGEWILVSRATPPAIEGKRGLVTVHTTSCSSDRIWSRPIRFEIWIYCLATLYWRRTCIQLAPHCLRLPMTFLWLLHSDGTTSCMHGHQTLFILRLKGVASETKWISGRKGPSAHRPHICKIIHVATKS